MTETKPIGSPVAKVQAGPGTPPKAPTPKVSSRKKTLALTGAAIASVALAYGVGRLQGALALDSALERHQNDQKTWQAQLATCQTNSDLLNARRSLSLVALALDRRNFGVAETHRREALEALARPSLSGIPEVATLATSVRELRLDVDPNPGTKRDQVIATTETLDRLSARAVKSPAPAGSAVSKP